VLRLSLCLVRPLRQFVDAVTSAAPWLLLRLFLAALVVAFVAIFWRLCGFLLLGLLQVLGYGFRRIQCLRQPATMFAALVLPAWMAPRSKLLAGRELRRLARPLRDWFLLLFLGLIAAALSAGGGCMLCMSIEIQPFSSSTSCRLLALICATRSDDSALMRAFSMPVFASCNSASSCWICCCACWTICSTCGGSCWPCASSPLRHRRREFGRNRALDALRDFVGARPVHRRDNLVAGNVHELRPGLAKRNHRVRGFLPARRVAGACGYGHVVFADRQVVQHRANGAGFLINLRTLERFD
jgi:hypothetical protein